MRLSQHFELDELTRSDVAARCDLDNEPTPREVDNLRRLCLYVLEPIRNALGRPVFVSSGYRSIAVNAAVGGSKTSDHMQGLAADIVAPPIAIDAIVRTVWTLSDKIPIKQCIHEFGRWVHVSVLEEGDARTPQFLSARRVDGQTLYGQWTA